jgi:hypothetical protein
MHWQHLPGFSGEWCDPLGHSDLVGCSSWQQSQQVCGVPPATFANAPFKLQTNGQLVMEATNSRDNACRNMGELQ